MHTHKHFLRELSKFAAGLIAADFLMGLWLLLDTPLPISLFGIVWPASRVMAWMAFDALLLIVLVHYSWHANIHTPSAKQRNLFITVGIITGIIAIVHALRLVFGVRVVIGGWQAPYWVSLIATIAAGYIAYTSFRFSAK